MVRIRCQLDVRTQNVHTCFNTRSLTNKSYPFNSLNIPGVVLGYTLFFVFLS